MELTTLRKRIEEEVEKSLNIGHNTFIMGACYGFDLMAAEVVLAKMAELRDGNLDNIRLVAAVPFTNQPETFSAADRDLYYLVLDQCSEVETLNDEYRRGCYSERNRWMVDHSSHLICYWNGRPSGTGHTVKYARKKGLKIVNLHDEISS
jgi:uncharacterized phage-like protein YoqJ